jgi:hypothetical protein
MKPRPEENRITTLISGTHSFRVQATNERSIVRSGLPHVLEGGVEAGEHEEEDDDHGDGPRRAPLGRPGVVAVGPPPALGGVEAEVSLEGLDGGDPLDEEDERDGHGQQQPAELLRGLLDEVLVGEEPGHAQKQRHHEQDQDHRVRHRRQRERLQQGGLHAPVAVVRHGRAVREGGEKRARACKREEKWCWRWVWFARRGRGSGKKMCACNGQAAKADVCEPHAEVVGAEGDSAVRLDSHVCTYAWRQGQEMRRVPFLRFRWRSVISLVDSVLCQRMSLHVWEDRSSSCTPRAERRKIILSVSAGSTTEWKGATKSNGYLAVGKLLNGRRGFSSFLDKEINDKQPPNNGRLCFRPSTRD